MNIWKLLIKKQELEMYFLNHISGVVKFPLLFKYKNIRINNKRIITSTLRKDRITIIMNGPSIKDQDFSKLVGEDVMFVNRGFKHPLYSVIKPKYHVFVDSKIKNGIWPISWLDDILAINPDTIFVMPAEWACLDILQPYIHKKVKFLWLMDNKPFIGGIGVTGAAIRAAIKCGYKNIYITGFEKTGFANELLKQASHFYGINEENNLKNWDDYTQDFYMNFLTYVGLKKEAKKWKMKRINITNITKGGLVEVFPREDFDKVFIKY